MNPTQGQVTDVNASLSHVGMIIHSTTLDTEAKVKAIYGSNTSWIQHSGYVLRGATSGVTANNATKTGGNDGAWLMKHSHTINYANAGNSGAVVGAANQYGPNSGYTTSVAGSVDSTSTTANIPNYKSVYIWERTA